MAVKQKNRAAVALGRKGGKKGGFARAAKLSPEQRSESARKAVQARWSKAKGSDYIVVKETHKGIKKFHKPINEATPAATAIKTSDNALLALLRRIKAANDPTEIKQLSNQLERVIFHKQFKTA
jgi:hypothetical protein